MRRVVMAVSACALGLAGAGAGTRFGPAGESAFTPAVAAQPASGEWSDRPLAQGRSRFAFSGWQGAAIPVWAYVPTGIDQRDAPILFVMHGAQRDPMRYLEEWIPHAQQAGFIVLVPEFSRKDFPTSRQYNLGWLQERGEQALRPRARWSFAAIEPLFDFAVDRLGSTRQGYTLYGHSAGSQFTHRFLFTQSGARVERYLPANAGWYSFPDLARDYPFGLGGIGLGEADLRAALAKDVVILLGDEDTDTRHPSLNRSADAMRQGPHRFARGMNFYRAGRNLAEEKGWKFGWRIEVIEGAAHENGKMAAGAHHLVR